MAKNLAIQSLEFDDIKENLIQSLKSQDKFKDFNFYGSGFDVLLDTLAYNTHYAGFYAHMLANESFVDSAHLKQSLTSRAKLVNYIPRSTNSAIAEVKIKINNMDSEPATNSVLIKRGDIATASKEQAQLTGDGRKFIILDDLYIYNKSLIPNELDYTSDVVSIYEGVFSTEKFIRDASLLNQRFIVRSREVDYRTIRIKIYPNDTFVGTDNFISYKLANDFMNINKDSNVFFLSVNEDDYYEVFFGNDVYGKAVNHNNIIEITYVDANGEIGNDAKNFFFTGDLPVLSGTNVNATLETINASDGGRDGETLEELRFNIPHHYRRQNRLVSLDDYKSILLSEYGNISSISTWGGEDHYPKSYGNVYISIKPKFGDVLSSRAKSKIINDILKKYNVATIDPIIIDPDFLYVNISTTTRFNPDKTDRTAGEITTLIHDVIKTYDEDNVSRFDGYYSDSILNRSIMGRDKAIITTYNDIELEKRFTPSLDTTQSYYIDFNNEIVPNTIKSDEFMFRNRKTYISDDNGNVNVWWYNTSETKWVKYVDEVFGTVDYTTGLMRIINVVVEKILTSNSYIKTTAKPINPDFFPLRNNIVTINKISTNIIKEYQKK